MAGLGIPNRGQHLHPLGASTQVFSINKYQNFITFPDTSAKMEDQGNAAFSFLTIYAFFPLSFLLLAGTMLPFEIRVLTGRVPVVLFLFIDPVAETPGMNKNLQ